MNFSDLCKFEAKQLQAAQAVKQNIYTLYGGSAGGGKSYFLRWEALNLLLYYTGKYGIRGVRVGLFCEDYPALKERHLSKIEFEFPDWLGTLNKSEHEFRLNAQYGSGVIAFRNLDDPSKYLSSEFAAILVDELTKNPRETFDFLNMRRRWPGINDTRFVGSSNPGGIGHAFVKKLWIDRDFTGERYNPKDFQFIRARVEDNPHLGQDYILTLDSLPEKLRKAYKDGDWDIFEGQYFSEFSRDKHVIEPFEIPDGWMRFRCMDYGYVKPSAVYWCAVDFDGKIYVYRELYVTGRTYAQLAEEIVSLTPEKERIEYTIADTSMFAKTLDTGEYGNDIMARNGVEITGGNKERIPGWNRLREYLKNDLICWFSTCTNAIRSIPSLVHDNVRVEDLDSDGEDHSADSIRMGLMSMPDTPINKPTLKPPPPNPYANDPNAPWNKKGKGGGVYSYS